MSVTKDEFIQLQKSVARRETRRLWVVFVVSVGTIAVVAGFGKAILNNPAVEDFFLSLVTRHRHWIPAGFGLLVAQTQGAVHLAFALPLIDLLTSAAARGKNVMWDN